MGTRTEVYVDTSALIAFLDRSDTYHPLFSELFADPPRLVTTPLVIAEGHGWFLRRFDSTRALQFLAFVDALRPLRVLPMSSSELQAAGDWLRRFKDQPLTLADAVGFVVMRDRRIQSCWSTDRHLGLSGVPLVIHER